MNCRPVLPLLFLLFICAAGLAGCSRKPPPAPAATATQPVAYYHVDPGAAGTVTGTVHFSGRRPARPAIDMSEDPACVAAHPGKQYEETLVVNQRGELANAFVYVEAGLEDKRFAVPDEPVTIDQRGCWFRPRVLGLQAGQTLQVINSDQVTHNIHPMATVNREWNHSQGPGDPPIDRRFAKAEVMIPVKCNIHSWMHSFIGVLDHPYFAVTKEDGSFALGNLPPGGYTIAVWQQGFEVQRQQVTIAPRASVAAKFEFKGR